MPLTEDLDKTGFDQSHYSRLIFGMPVTYNSLEVPHDALQSATNSLPSIWKLLKYLRREEPLASKQLRDLLLGADDRKKKYRSINEKLGIIIQS